MLAFWDGARPRPSETIIDRDNEDEVENGPIGTILDRAGDAFERAASGALIVFPFRRPVGEDRHVENVNHPDRPRNWTTVAATQH
jgi:hypothetical protein